MVAVLRPTFRLLASVGRHARSNYAKGFRSWILSRGCHRCLKSKRALRRCFRRHAFASQGWLVGGGEAGDPADVGTRLNPRKWVVDQNFAPLFDRGDHLSPHIVFVGVPGRAFTPQFAVCRGERGAERRGAHSFEVANPHCNDVSGGTLSRRSGDSWAEAKKAIPADVGTRLNPRKWDVDRELRPDFSTVVAI